MKWTKQRLNNLFFFLGVAAVVVMLLTFDVSFVELWQHLCHAGYWLIPIVGVWIFIYGINALSWQTIIRSKCEEGEHVSFWRIYRLTITGYALNYATPVGGLGESLTASWNCLRTSATSAPPRQSFSMR